MKEKTSGEDIFSEIIEVTYGITLMLGPLTLPIALLATDVQGRWISFVATPIFVITFLIKKKRTQSYDR